MRIEEYLSRMIELHIGHLFNQNLFYYVRFLGRKIK